MTYRLRRRLDVLDAALLILAALVLLIPWRRSFSYILGRFSDRFHLVPGMPSSVPREVSGNPSVGLEGVRGYANTPRRYRGFL